MYVHLCSRLFRGALYSPDRSSWHICELLFSTLSFIYFYLPDQGNTYHKACNKGAWGSSQGLTTLKNKKLH